MTSPAVDALLERCNSLEVDAAIDDWRQLAVDVLDALIAQQGIVISMQRRALEGTGSPETRARVKAAFVLVQRLNKVRWKIQAVLASRRTPMLGVAA